MNGTRPLFFIALGLFGLYAVEFGVVGILPAVVERYGITVALAGWLVALFAGVVVVCGPAMVLWLSRFDRRKVLAASLLVFSLCSLLSAWAPSFGVVLGAAVGGGFIDAAGMQGTVWSGWLFAALAVSTVLARKPWWASEAA
ncbi:MFS transporter [Brenneria tiliae]|uniref:MFS transporter n=1 Tax=Brenneria tiliae TaxID=2914984 RepID=UPI002014A4C1|nr:MFS transporter [Brenneria tiliae]MCL2896136.1 MFS transporter [Brenneria tiliae]MCL2900669.1 MFS transporter [Brenneria tiliae]